jgi:hypothetical protein
MILLYYSLEDGERNIHACKEDLTSLSITRPVSTFSTTIIPSSCFPLKQVRVNVTNVLDTMNLRQWRSKLRDILLPNNTKNMFVNVEHVKETKLIFHWKKNLVLQYFLSHKKVSSKTIVKKVNRKSISDKAFRKLMREMRKLFPDTVSEL